MLRKKQRFLKSTIVVNVGVHEARTRIFALPDTESFDLTSFACVNGILRSDDKMLKSLMVSCHRIVVTINSSDENDGL